MKCAFSRKNTSIENLRTKFKRDELGENAFGWIKFEISKADLSKGSDAEQKSQKKKKVKIQQLQAVRNYLSEIKFAT